MKWSGVAWQIAIASPSVATAMVPFMTANLLAHTRQFRAGIARSGPYNRTLTPFGLQAEERPFCEECEAACRGSER